LLGGYGSITTRKREGNIEIARLKISSKPDLLRVVCPIFDKYPMLTSKHYDYINFRDCLLTQTPLYSKLPQYTQPEKLPFDNIYQI